MPTMLAKGLIEWCVTYRTALDSAPEVAAAVDVAYDPDISLVLIARDAGVLGETWTPARKLLVAAEHPRATAAALRGLGVADDCVTITAVLGASEGYVAAGRMHLCDAVCDSGETVRASELCVVHTIIPKGDVMYGLYRRIQS
jgi:ATP phosphoribosyltransferase